ncbi:MAG: GIY-YIG nuclease family protein [Patescibacteria group bacterium]
MYFVYVLQSEKDERLYIGSSADLDKRLKQHNSGKTKSTKPYRPYKLIYTEEFQSKTEALQREKQIKNSGFIRKQLKDGNYNGPIV